MSDHETARALRRVIQGAVVGGVAAVLAAVLWLVGVTGGFEAKTWDLRARLLARPGAATSQVVTILLDQYSLNWGKKENGWPWPWPREVYAAVTSFCKRAGAKALVFDLILTEQSGFGVSDDQAFGQGVADNGRVVGAMNLARDVEQGNTTAWPAGVPAPKLRVTGQLPASLVFPARSSPSPSSPRTRWCSQIRIFPPMPSTACTAASRCSTLSMERWFPRRPWLP